MTKSNTPDPQQHETSSLFSLSSLQEMSGTAPAPAPSKPPSAAEEEGSGMLDILAIAGSAKQASPAGRIVPRPTPTPSLLTSPVAQAAEEGMSSRTKLIMAGMGVAIILLGGATAFLALRPAATASVVGPVAGEASVVPPGPAAAVPAAALAPQPSQEPAPAAVEPAAAPEPAKVASDKRARASKPEAREEAAEAVPAAEKSTDKSIDNLLDQALGGGGVVAPKKAKSEAKPTAGAASPSREEVLAAMSAVTPKVKACGKGEGGVAMAKITMTGATGRVTNVDVGGITDAGVKMCVTREVSKAKVPSFSNPTFSVTYPFKL